MNGKLIGKYQITSEYAQGRMGTVYRALNTNDEREVILKSYELGKYSKALQTQIKASLRRAVFVQRQMSHQHIVNLLDAFVYEQDYYIAYEFFAGATLRDLLARQGVPNVAQAVNYAKQLTSALEYAHKFSYLDESDFQHVGVFHGDLRLSNLLLDARGLVKLTDFSCLHKVMGAELYRQYPELQPYLAPEQTRHAAPDARTDVYGAGLALYEMLTGRLPHTLTSRAEWQQERTNLDQDVARSLLEIRQDVPQSLALVIARAVRKNSFDRYASIADFWRAIHSCEELAGNHEIETRKGLSGKLNTSLFNSAAKQPAKTETVTPAAQEWQFGDSASVFGGKATTNNLPQLSGVQQPALDAAFLARRQPTGMQAKNDGYPAGLYSNVDFSMLPRELDLGIAPPRVKKRSWWLFPAMVASALLGIFAGAYLFTSPKSNEGLAAEPKRTTEVPVTASATLPLTSGNSETGSAGKNVEILLPVQVPVPRPKLPRKTLAPNAKLTAPAGPHAAPPTALTTQPDAGATQTPASGNAGIETPLTVPTLPSVKAAGESPASAPVTKSGLSSKPNGVKRPVVKSTAPSNKANGVAGAIKKTGTGTKNKLPLRAPVRTKPRAGSVPPARP